METTNYKTILFNNITEKILNNGNKYDMRTKDKENLKRLIKKFDKEKIINKIITEDELDKITNDYIRKVRSVWTLDERNEFLAFKYTTIDKNFQDELIDFIEKLKESQEKSSENINFEIKLIKYQTNKIINKKTQKEKNNQSYCETNKKGISEKSEVGYAFIIFFINNYSLSLFELRVEIKDFDILQYLLLFRGVNIFYKTENFEPKYTISWTFKIELELPNNKSNYYLENIQNDKCKFDFDKIKLAESRKIIITEANKNKLSEVIERFIRFKDDNQDKVIYKLDKLKTDNEVKISLIINDCKYLYTFILENSNLWDAEIDKYC